MEAESSLTRWGDIEDAEDNMTGTKVYETPADETGTRYKTVIDYSVNEEGKTVKTVKKYKIYTKKTKISRAVQERKKWTKFGDAKQGEQGVTIVGEPVGMETTARKQRVREEEALKAASQERGKKETWTSRASRLGAGSWDEITSAFADKDASGKTDDKPADNIYVPRGVRKGEGGKSERDDASTIRVTNLSEDTREDDLRELCRRFGPIQRVYLARDRNTNLSRGFAFVTFFVKEDAAKAIEGLDGYGYDHLILSVEWAKPSRPY
jgi:translation initiation factor 3 subunit G